MKKEVKGNRNYCGTVAAITKLIPIVNADKIQKAIVLNTAVVVSKEVKVGDVGIFFPVETALSDEFITNNNLYRKKELNVDVNKSGFIEENRRVRCVKLRGEASEGLFLSLDSLRYLGVKSNEFTIGDEFDHLNNVKICEKYIVSEKNNNAKTDTVKKPKKKIKKESKLVENQFRLHYDTSQLRKNLHHIERRNLLSITEKIHGTSLVVSNCLINKKLSLKDKIAKFLKVNVVDTEYGKIYSSRKVIKNEFHDSNKNKANTGFYKTDIWGRAADIIYPFLKNGMTAYAEIVGYLDNGSEIQKGYTYNCEKNKFSVLVYRLTYTNNNGDVIEMPFMQMKEYFDNYGIDTVPLIFYGYAEDYLDIKYDTEEEFQEAFLQKLESEVQNKECSYNKGKPKEGYVIKFDGINTSYAFKYKNIAFLEHETKMIDKGEVDIEGMDELVEN